MYTKSSNRLWTINSQQNTFYFFIHSFHHTVFQFPFRVEILIYVLLCEYLCMFVALLSNHLNYQWVDKVPEFNNSVHANWLHPLWLVVLALISYVRAGVRLNIHRVLQAFFSFILYIGLMDFNSRIVLVQIETFIFISSNHKSTNKTELSWDEMNWTELNSTEQSLCLSFKSTVNYSSLCHMIMMVK